MKRTLYLLAVALVIVVMASPARAQRREVGSNRGTSSSSGGSSAPAAPRNGGGSVSGSGSSQSYAPPPATAPAPPPAIGVTVDAGPPSAVPLSDTWAGSDESEERDDAIVLWDFHTAPGAAGFDFSSDERCAYDDPEADIVFESRDGRGYIEVSRDTDIRDLGSTTDSSDRPATAAWSLTHEVLLTPGHTYVVWTWDDQFFRFVVTDESGQRVRYLWTQMDEDTNYRVPGLVRNGRTRPVFVRTKFPL